MATEKQARIHTAIRLNPETRRELERLAAEDRRTFSDYVRLVLEWHVEQEQREGVA